MQPSCPKSSSVPAASAIENRGQLYSIHKPLCSLGTVHSELSLEQWGVPPGYRPNALPKCYANCWRLPPERGTAPIAVLLCSLLPWPRVSKSPMYPALSLVVSLPPDSRCGVSCSRRVRCSIQSRLHTKLAQEWRIQAGCIGQFVLLRVLLCGYDLDYDMARWELEDGHLGEWWVLD